MRQILTFALAAMAMLPAWGASDSKGGISAAELAKMRASYGQTPSNRAIHNALNAADIDKLAANAGVKNHFDSRISNRVKSKGITNQKSSGRCWCFTGLNVLRAQAMQKHDLAKLELSQNYNFFFDQLEKANLFLQGVIDTADKPMEDNFVMFLFKSPVSDGGQYTGISENLMKYGVVPIEVMGETLSSSSTGKMSRTLKTMLRRDGLELRKMKQEGKSAKDIAARKQEMLDGVYRLLALTLGEPPTEFTWTRTDSKGNVVDTRTYTPQSFYKEYIGNDLKSDYVMTMNDPTREYFKLYEIDYDRAAYDGKNWTYVNLPMDVIKDMAIASIKDSTMMYFSCDVGKYLNRELGYGDPDNYDYEALLGVELDMPKADRIRSYESASTHAMTLVGVDLDKQGKPRQWLVENSWGPGANDGHLIMSDSWMDEYLFRLVVEKKYAPKEVLDVLNQKPITLPAWDYMFQEEQ